MNKENQKAGNIVVVRIRGSIGVRTVIKDTFNLLRLYPKNIILDP